MTYGKRQGLSAWGKVAAFVFGLFLAGCLQAATSGAAGPEARGFPLRPSVRLSTHRVNGSRVRVVKAPVSMLEALPGCKRFPCGRQSAMLPSVNGARHDAVVAIGGDFVRNGRPVHAYVHNGRVRERGIRNGDAFMIRDGEATIQRGHDWMLHEADELFGGYPQVLEGGQVPSDRGDCKNVDGPDGGFCLRQPRQGVGLSRDGERVIVIEVDGRQPGWSRGMLLPEFGRLFKRFGAYNALNLDGGGSAVMWTHHRTKACQRPGGTRDGCLVSRPVYDKENPPTGERRITQSVMVIP